MVSIILKSKQWISGGKDSIQIRLKLILNNFTEQRGVLFLGYKWHWFGKWYSGLGP